jgi:hypothetical protein
MKHWVVPGFAFCASYAIGADFVIASSKPGAGQATAGRRDA